MTTRKRQRPSSHGTDEGVVPNKASKINASIDDSEDEEEQRLRESLFGISGEQMVQRYQGTEHADDVSNSSDDASDDEALFVIDKAPTTANEVVKGDNTEDDESQPETSAWVDEDDNNVSVDLAKMTRLRKLRNEKEVEEKDTVVSGVEFTKRLRAQHQKIYNNPSWAETDDKIKEADNMDSDDEVDASNEQLIESDKAQLFNNGKIDIARVKDANQNGVSDAVVQCVDWHKNAQLMLTAGMDKKLRLFKVDGKQNAKVQSVFFRDLPIMSACFIGPKHDEVLCSGRRSFFYTVDLNSGKMNRIPKLLGRPEKSLESAVASNSGDTFSFLGYDGNILLVSQKTKQWIANLKMNGSARCAAYTQDGNYLYSAGGSGDVYKWDLRMRRCLHRHQDLGSLGARSIAVSQNGNTYAIGQESGVVNIYDASLVGDQFNPQPLKSIMNLTTAIDQVSFNHDASLLVMLSRRKRESLRVVHVPSLRVVSNWPTRKTPLRYASCAQFSPNSGFLSIGNDKGRCLLYRVKHFAQA